MFRTVLGTMGIILREIATRKKYHFLQKRILHLAAVNTGNKQAKQNCRKDSRSLWGGYIEILLILTPKHDKDIYSFVDGIKA